MRILDNALVFLRRDIWDDSLTQGRSRLTRAAVLWLRKRILEGKLFFRTHAIKSASALSFTTIVSLIPLLAVLFMGFKMFDGREVLEKIKPSLYTFLTPGASEDFTSTLDTMLQSASVDTIGMVGFIFLLGSVYSLLSSIEETVNKIWGVSQNRKFLDALKVYGFLLIAFPIFIGLSSVVSSYVRELGENVVGGFSNFFGTIAFPFIMVTLVFFIFIYVMPNCAIRASRAWLGAFVGAALFSISEEAFLYYTKMAVSTNLIYGSLAVLPLFFLWLYIAWMIVLYVAIAVYVHHNIAHLTAIERSHDIGHTDEVRLGTMAAIILTEDALALRGGAVGLSPSEIASAIGAPERDVRELLSRLEKMSIIARIVGREERFMLRIAPTRCTLGMVLDALDRAWLGTNQYSGEAKFPIYPRLFYKNIPRLKRYRDISILSVAEMNSELLQKNGEGSDPARGMRNEC